MIFKPTCRILRATVAIVALLFVSGGLLQIPVLAPFLHLGAATAYLSFIGLMAMLAGFLLLLAIGLLTLLPAVNAGLESCQH